MEQKDEGKIVICAGAEKKRNRKLGDGSDDSDDDKFRPKGKNLKSKKYALKSSQYTIKVKR